MAVTTNSWPLDYGDDLFAPRAVGEYGRSRFGAAWEDRAPTPDDPVEPYNLIIGRKTRDLENLINDRQVWRARGAAMHARTRSNDNRIQQFREMPDRQFQRYVDRLRAALEDLRSKQLGRKLSRIAEVERELATLALAGKLICRLRPVQGGQRTQMPPEWWDGPDYSRKLRSGRVNIRDPFSEPDDDEVAAYIFIGRSSLAAASKRPTGKPQNADRPKPGPDNVTWLPHLEAVHREVLLPSAQRIPNKIAANLVAKRAGLRPTDVNVETLKTHRRRLDRAAKGVGGGAN